MHTWQGSLLSARLHSRLNAASYLRLLAVPKVSSELKTQISKARTAKKMTQAQLAQVGEVFFKVCAFNCPVGEHQSSSALFLVEIIN